MAGTPPFSAAPNQTSNKTSGWTPKIIYSYQNIDSNSWALVDVNENVFDVIEAGGVGKKGNYILPNDYFNNPNINQGRVIKITMHFFRDFDGENISFKTGLIENSTEDWYMADFSNTVTIAGGGGGDCYCKYECYFNVLETTAPTIFLQVIGDIQVQKNTSGDLGLMSIRRGAILTPGFGEKYKLAIVNRMNPMDSNPIRVTNLIVEEIG
jgi:hypothetical protein